MKAAEYRDQSVQELEALLGEMQRKLFDLVNVARETKKVDKPHEIRALKKDRARLLTVLRERELGIGS